MFSFSQSASYAILALACLTHEKGLWVRAKDVVQATGIPKPYLLKILNSLVREELIEAKRGYRGGFRLCRPSEDITLSEISNTIDGPDSLSKCLLGLKECSDERNCPAHEFWSVERMRIKAILEELTLADMAAFEWSGWGNRPIDHALIKGET